MSGASSRHITKLKQSILLRCLGYKSNTSLVLPCLLLLMMPILAGSGFGWVTAIGAVLVIVVIVGAGIIRAEVKII